MKYNTVEEVVVAVVKDFAAYYKDVVDMFLENRLDNRGQFIMNELYKDIKDSTCIFQIKSASSTPTWINFTLISLLPF